eukprot:9846138-Karenia_brevis.AAC.1
MQSNKMVHCTQPHTSITRAQAVAFVALLGDLSRSPLSSTPEWDMGVGAAAGAEAFEAGETDPDAPPFRPVGPMPGKIC